MPIRCSDFFHLPSVASPSLRRRLVEFSPLCTDDHTSFILAGSERSGKTSLMVQLAYTLASRGASVLFITSRERLEGSPPLLAEGVTYKDTAWAQIRIKYIDDYMSLLKYASLLHMDPHPANVILIDDFDEIMKSQSRASFENWCGGSVHGVKDPRLNDANVCRILSLLVDSLEFIASAHSKETVLGISAKSPTIREAAAVFHLHRRWLRCLIGCGNIGVDPPNIGSTAPDSRSFVATLGEDGACGPLVEYSMYAGYLKVEDIIDGERIP